MRPRRHGLAWLLALGALAPRGAAQAAPRPQPYCIRGVSLDRAGEHKGTLVLRDGAIAAILDESAPTPPGTRVIEGAGLLCLPTFLDAFARQGCTVPAPVKDQDLPPNEQADVGIDMRLANRKGIQPGFRAVEGLALTKEQREAWRKAGFGAVLIAPGGELLAGASALVTTRDAAMRDLVVREEVFAHAAFGASGPGYPSTLMGYFAQLRQFFLDSQRQLELEQRRAQGRPGPRPAFDVALGAGAQLVGGQRTLVCEANQSDDFARWQRLADEFGLRLGFAGGTEAWRVQDELASRGSTVVLTLDWGKEPKDPRPKEEPKPQGAAEEKPAEASEVAAAKPAEPETVAKEAAWEYEEPYAVRLERRLKWEKNRDCALRLAEAGVRFAFGTASGKPAELIEHVRALVKTGLAPERALAALTHDAAEFLGVGSRLGKLEPGFDATFTLWRADPLTDEKASVAWAFVDGFPSEFQEEKKKDKGAGPSEGLDASGTWQLEFRAEGEGVKTATLVLEMAKDGTLKGTLEVENPMGGAHVTSSVSGVLSADELELDCTLSFGQFSIDVTLTATLAGDELDGESTFEMPGGDEPVSQPFTGTRAPK